MEHKYTNTQHVMAFSFVVFMMALTIPAKLAMAYPAYTAVNNTPFAAMDSLATAIGAAPALSLFMLGFVSAMLFLGVIWDKFSFVNMAPIGVRSPKKRRRSSKRGGYISTDLVSYIGLALLLMYVLSSPAFV